ncbi:cysteine--tRNA ligase [Limosilactobacillus vaginalis]|uniref:Cysteine--tRNA ligase n=1 Tax=Limosilactobacillus vaginalis DSM 5837 = ATCC 49540 TaxID=1423814 RepID=C2ET80_9LACO|nr:cysteine--tRNA ligase [Limosilactobacillus vaginalis]PEH04540.1 cysteine--tRNA ligase [Lactobacillus sp. UMNPBX5]EEJ40863.1 cysteine--tRNA ligase [Limosilactobacillus vaginalis DSM 5837 = ATCC 49540]KRM49143.1 cysteinyl-tRNA synthetase [Limosilactobacillus vaginalis DSM 5837 = ATCC 49540]QFS33680.1 cysteine--tRNA ligase [Limosilactobacillus vaginalis]UXC69479.1 cysteine--tRNA ligase [Limosilactobacillus vaginalis]
MLTIYNTLTRKQEEFKPQTPGVVNMYVCGPTVYNYIHIGNARSAIAFDTVRRYLEFKGYKVNYVSNFTDVDDKMIKAAHEQGITVPQLADKYIQAFMEDTKAINIEPATMHPRATENIPEIIKFIQGLIDKGYAYEKDGDVYYRARKFKDYGQLSGQSIDDLEVGASEHVSDDEINKKEDPMDFALWKAAKPGEINWDSPWGKGRPGWHIECSVMSTKYLGKTIDIHGGGQDLEFPHHENEIAQSEAKTGQKFVRYWMHNGFVTIGKDNEKMSKSLHNFITVHDIIKQVDPQVLRFFMATTQYRRPIQYSEDNLIDAKNNLEHIQTAFDNLTYRQKDAQDGADPVVTQKLADFKQSFTEAMDNDINVQNGITVVYELVKFANVYAQQKAVKAAALTEMKDLISELVSIFGVKLASSDNELNDEHIQALIDERNEARKNKDFARSDQIRDELKAQGIILEDTPQGTRFKRVKK